MIIKSVDLDVKKFNREIELFLSVTDRRYWEELIGKVSAVGGIFYKNYYLLKRNPFIEGIREFIQLSKAGKSIWKNRSAEIDYLAQRVFVINRIINNINDKAKNQIIGRLKGGDIRPLLHEITIATHFLRNGFEVYFIEYERPDSVGRTFDFLVSKISIEAEIERKWKSYDAGRKIKRDGFCLLCDELMKQLTTNKVKCLIEINCSKNLGKNHNTFVEIVKEIKSAITTNNKKIIFDEDFSININYLPAETIIDSKEKFTTVVQPYLTPKSHFATVSNKEMTVIIKVESEDNDKVLMAMYDELKNSLDQFSKKRPALIACYIEGIYPEQWEELKGKNGLSIMTAHFLKKENASHIHTVAYSSEVEISSMGNIIDHSYPVLFFKNENGLYFKDQDVFNLTSTSLKWT